MVGDPRVPAGGGPGYSLGLTRDSPGSGECGHMSGCELRLAVVVGNPKPGSRTRTVALRAAELLQQGLALERITVAKPSVLDLAELAPHLLGRQADGEVVDTALTTVRHSALLLVASPTFKKTYSGLLKLFLDLLPRGGLVGVIVLPLMTAAQPAHKFAVEGTLRPVLAELGAQLPTRGIAVLETEFAAFDDVFETWWTEHRRALGSVLNGQGSGQETAAPRQEAGRPAPD